MSTLDNGNAEFKIAAEKVKTTKGQDLTEDLCMKAVSYDWKNIRFVPNGMKTKELCEIQLGRIIRHLNIALKI